MRSRLVPLLLAVLAVGVAVAAAVVLLGRGGPGGGGLDFLDTPYYRVLYDDDATGADVVEVAESPDELVALDDGTQVRLYEIADQEGGEAQKAAVQVRRPGAEPVARLVPPMLDLTAVGDHAVLHSQDGAVTTVDVDGEVTPVTRTTSDEDGLLVLEGMEPADGVESGDVLAGNLDVTTLYRPSNRTVHEVPLPEREEHVVPMVAIGGGRIWVVSSEGSRATVQSSSDGSRWSSVDYDLDAGASPVALRADGDTLAVLDAEAPDMAFVATSVHLVTGGEVRALPVPDGVDDGTLARTPDGRLLVGSNETWLEERDGVLRPLDVPGEVRTMSTAGRDLVALGDGEAWTSADDGETWRSLDD